MSDLKKFDPWISGNAGPAALLLREYLTPIEGHDGVIFPPTFAASKDKSFPGGYNIDKFSEKENVCLIDSVGSQANRIEPLFMDGEYAKLIPQIVIKAGEQKINLLEAGHRAGDAIVRCSPLKNALHDAFLATRKGDASLMAKLAPTSLVFGVWDSRDTQAKLPRLIASTIRAFNVQRITRSAQFIPATEYVSFGLLADPEGEQKLKDSYAERGFIHVPASCSPGGIIATGGIRRDATLSLTALRLLRAGTDSEKTIALRRYILGLAMVAFTHESTGYLRQGCQLVMDAEKVREFMEVYNSGERKASGLTHAEAICFAKAAAEAFVVGENQTVDFVSTGAQNQPVEGASKPATLRGKGLTGTLCFFIFMKELADDGQSTQNGRHPDNFIIACKGLVNPADCP